MAENSRDSDEPRNIDLSGGNNVIPQLYNEVPKSFLVKNALEAMSLEASGRKPEEFYNPNVIREFNPNRIRRNS